MRGLKITSTITILLFLIANNINCQHKSQPHGNDWTKWNGPFANGTTDEKIQNPKALTDSSRILWKKNIGKGHSMVATKGSNTFVFGNKMMVENGDTSYYDVVSCLDSEKASEVWSYKYKSDAGSRFPGSNSSPVVDDNYLYSFSRNGDFYCLNALTGKVNWKHQIIEMGYKSPGFGFSCSPLIHENKVMIKVGETGIAFNKKTGEKIWQGDTTQYNSYSSGVLYNNSEEKSIVLLNGDSLHIVNLMTGKKLNRCQWIDGGSDPLIIKNSVFLSNMSGGTTLLDISKNPPEQVWKNDSLKGLFQGFVKSGNYLYGFASKKNKMPLRCINLENGKIEWEKDLGKWGSLIVADNKLVIITGEGRLVIADASPKDFNELSSLQVFNINAEDYKKNINVCWTKPVLSHGKIYVRTTLGDVACIDMR